MPHLGTAGTLERAAAYPNAPRGTADDLGYCLDAPHYIPAGSVTSSLGERPLALSCERTKTKDVPWALR